MAHSTNQGDRLHQSDGLVDARVIDASGNQATIVSIDHTGTEAQAWIRLNEGTQVLVPVALLAQDTEGTYRLPFTFHLPDGDVRPTQMTFPVMEEEMHVGKRTVDTGRGVRIHKAVSEHEEMLNEALFRDELTVEHVPVGRVLDESDAPKTRYEGDTLVVPVLEEVLVVRKQLRLKEEVHITRHRREVSVPQKVVLRSEQVTVERFDEGRKQ